MTMNKGEFVVELAERCDLSKAEAGRTLDAILDSLTEAMADRDEVSLTGWGKFSAQRRKGREAHDPRDPSRTVHIGPGYVPKFKAGTVFKREIHDAHANTRGAASESRPAPQETASRQTGETSPAI